MKYIITFLVLITLFSCKESNVLDQLTNEDSITLTGHLIFIGNVPFQDPAIKVDGIKYPILIHFEDRTNLERSYQIEPNTLITVSGRLEKLVNHTADKKHTFVIYMLNVPSE